MHGWYGDGMGSMMAWWWLLWIVVIAVAVWALAKGVGGRTAGHEESPEAILKRRYARGEINREEYDQRLTDLRK